MVTGGTCIWVTGERHVGCRRDAQGYRLPLARLLRGLEALREDGEDGCEAYGREAAEEEEAGERLGRVGVKVRVGDRGGQGSGLGLG